MKNHRLLVLGLAVLALPACRSAGEEPAEAPAAMETPAPEVLPEIRYYEIADT